VAIVLFTVTVWALLLPLAVKQAHSVRARRALRQLDRPQASLA
jgi:membrane protein insertase Oxa1/YidC/SpoIIIJ